MYGWLWRTTPGPWWLKVLMAIALICAVVLFCFRVFFPWLSPKLPFNDNTIEMDNGGPVATAPAVVSPSPS